RVPVGHIAVAVVLSPMKTRLRSLVVGFDERERTHTTTDFLDIRPGKFRDFVRGLAFLRHYMLYMAVLVDRCFPPSELGVVRFLLRGRPGRTIEITTSPRSSPTNHGSCEIQTVDRTLLPSTSAKVPRSPRILNILVTVT